MLTFKEFVEALAGRAEGAVRHQHVTGVSIFSVTPPLPCGSEFFVKCSEAVTLGFTRDELVAFRDAIVEGVRVSLASTPSPAVEGSNLGMCIVCQLEVTADIGFTTSIGPMHFVCEKG